MHSESSQVFQSVWFSFSISTWAVRCLKTQVLRQVSISSTSEETQEYKLILSKSVVTTFLKLAQDHSAWDNNVSLTYLNFLLNTDFSLTSSLINLFAFDIDCQSWKNRHILDFWFLRGRQSSVAPECLLYYYINTWSWRVSHQTGRGGINTDETVKWKRLCGLLWISTFYPFKKFFLVFNMPSELSVS